VLSLIVSIISTDPSGFTVSYVSMSIVFPFFVEIFFTIVFLVSP
jgi:hypothetical protein